MRKFLPSLFCFLILASLVPSTAYSKEKQLRKTNPQQQPASQATPQSTPQASPSPTPQKIIQGTIVSIGADFITLNGGQPPSARTYKVTQNTQVSINSRPVFFASLKPGMTVAVTPTFDQTYANMIAASSLPGAPASR